MGGTTFGALPGAAPPPGAAPAPGAVHSFIHTIDTLPYSKGDLVMMSFATTYHRQNAGYLGHEDSVFTLSFGLIMLNTVIWSQKVLDWGRATKVHVEHGAAVKKENI